MATGFTSDHSMEAMHSIAYVSFQELATRISHRNTGRYSGDPICDQLLAKIAADENLHMVFYRNLLGAAMQIAPDEAMRAITDVVSDFQMPGHGIENFGRKSVQMAMAGIYDLRIHHDEVLQPVLRNLRVFEIEGLGSEGEKARQQLADFLSDLDGYATKFEERRATLQAKAAARAA